MLKLGEKSSTSFMTTLVIEKSKKQKFEKTKNKKTKKQKLFLMMFEIMFYITQQLWIEWIH